MDLKSIQGVESAGFGCQLNVGNKGEVTGISKAFTGELREVRRCARRAFEALGCSRPTKARCATGPL